MAAPIKPRAGDYGIDAPGVLLTFVGVAAASALAAVLAPRLGVRWLVTPACCVAASFAFSTCSFLYTTRRGKIRVWSELFRALNLRADGRVLDVGCGRGLLTVLAADCLPRGKAVGLDLWSTHDQSGNARSTTEQNAQLEGVADRVELHTGDMQALPFDPDSFDLVVSSLAVHNVAAREGRRQAIAEMFRVLKPGGQLLVADFRHTDDYAQWLRELGGADVQQRSLGWRFWYGGPQAATKLVRAAKPISGADGQRK